MKAKPKAVKRNGALTTKVEEVLGDQNRENKKRAVKDNRGDKSGVDVKVRVEGRGVCRSVCRPRPTCRGRIHPPTPPVASQHTLHYIIIKKSLCPNKLI